MARGKGWGTGTMEIAVDRCVTPEFERWAWATSPRDLAMPPHSRKVNEEFAAALGHVERRRLQILSLSAVRSNCGLLEQCYLSEFLEALAKCSPEQRGRWLRTYSLTYAASELQRRASAKPEPVPGTPEADALLAFANAYTFIQLQKGDDGIELPVAFDSAGEARYPGHWLYLRGGVHDRRSMAAIVRRGRALQIRRHGQETPWFPAAVLLSPDKVNAESMPYHRISDDLEVRQRPCIRGTSIQIDNEELVLMKQLEDANDVFDHVIGEGHRPCTPRRIVPVSPSDPEAGSLLADAVAAIQHLWPEAYEDLLFFTRLVVPYASEAGPTSWTERRLPGVTVQQVKPYSMPAMAASLLHENAHTRFAALTRLFHTHHNDGTERLSSPWRPDLRPVTGILLGTHAFAIAAHFYYRAICARVPWSDQLEPQLHVEVQRLRQGLDLLYQYADLTPFGMKFVGGLAESIELLHGAGWGC